MKEYWKSICRQRVKVSSTENGKGVSSSQLGVAMYVIGQTHSSVVSSFFPILVGRNERGGKLYFCLNLSKCLFEVSLVEKDQDLERRNEKKCSVVGKIASIHAAVV